MSNRNDTSGCSLIILGIIFIPMIIMYFYDEIFEKPERDNKEKKEFVNEWKQSNINYFKKFDCSNLTENPKVIKINKFYAFWTSNEVKCDEIKEMFNDFSKSRFGIHNIDLKFSNKNLDKYKTQIIDSSNVLIWIKTIPGELEGRYEGGSRAIRLINEINFIDTKTNIIYKKINVKCVGNPPEKVREGQTEKSKNYYFGTYSIDAITRIIEKEL